MKLRYFNIVLLVINFGSRQVTSDKHVSCVGELSLEIQTSIRYKQSAILLLYKNVTDIDITRILYENILLKVKQIL